MGGKEIISLCLLLASTQLPLAVGAEGGVETGGAPESGVLHHKVVYKPLPAPPKYKSNASFNPRGMEHVYFLANTFLDLIQRDNALPSSISYDDVNTAVQKDLDSRSTDNTYKLLKDHWQDIMLQYIGVLTTGICGILMALVIPVIGFFFCCCRCCGRCGAYPDTHYDKKADSCKRVSIGIFVSVFVMAAVFGAVCAFVTNYYTYQGSKEFTTKVDGSLDDAGMYLEHTGSSLETLLVSNYNELEEVIGQVLDDSGVILKDNLAKVTKAIAISNLTDIVAGLGRIRGNLKDIAADTETLDQKVSALRIGLVEAQEDLTKALETCREDARCNKFLQDYNLEKDLALAEEFVSIKFEMPDLASTLQGVSDLIQNDIERKVLAGKEEFDSIEKEIERSIDDIKPKVKAEMRNLGVQLSDQNNNIQAALNDIDIAAVQKDIPLIDQHSGPWIQYRYYAGIGLSSLVLLILLCFILGLFYGMFGKRPGGLYGDDCCNRGTGANCLVAGIYLTFLFSFPILIGTTAHFLLGASVEKVVCESLQQPQHSDLFRQVDRMYQPLLQEALKSERDSVAHNYSAVEILERCHSNQTLFNVLQLEKAYNLSELLNWRAHYGIKEFIENLKNKVRLDQLQNIRLLSPSTKRDLEKLASSKLSDMEFTQFTSLLENEITNIDLRSFISKLRQLNELLRFDRDSWNIASQIELQALRLESMNKVVTEMKIALRHLKSSVAQLQENSRFNQSSMRVAVTGLINQANFASEYLQKNGPTLVTDLTGQFATEIVGLIDQYSARVNHKINHEVGYCAPLSTSLNATVVSLCNGIVDPFNGFWAALGWCFMLYLPCIALGVSLVSLYRKSEPYGGPLVESQPLAEADRAGDKNRRKGHRRNPSSFLPEYTHSRPNPQQQSNSDARYRDIAPRNYGGDEGQPPRYTSNPSLPALPAGEYERPPPYYYPGPPAGGS